MIKKTDFFPRKWMSAETLTPSGAVYTIEKFAEHVFPARDGKPAATKPVLYFEKEAQGLVLNATNFDILFDAFGADERKWAGKRIALRKGRRTFGGKLVDSIEVHVADAESPAPKAPVVRRAEPEPDQLVPDETPPPDDDDWTTANAE